MQAPPLTLDWIEGQFVVTRVQKGKSEGIAPGDRILKIDGKPIDQAAADARSVISGATEQWIRWRSASVLSTCNSTARMSLEIEPYLNPGTRRTVELACVFPKMKVLKHDGSPHHGIGIRPTVPVSRTRKGVAEGKDEILLRALEVVKAH
jgi:C-terminal processing protease CtpA/Prc